MPVSRGGDGWKTEGVKGKRGESERWRGKKHTSMSLFFFFFAKLGSKELVHRLWSTEFGRSVMCKHTRRWTSRIDDVFVSSASNDACGKERGQNHW